MVETRQQPLDVLVGSRLSSVEFVLDYVQLRFDGPCLTAITHPVVEMGDARYKWESPGYRDALCDRIGQTVRRASVMEDEEIRLEFHPLPAITKIFPPQGPSKGGTLITISGAHLTPDTTITIGGNSRTLSAAVGMTTRCRQSGY